jgi:uncharacterized membrane protein YgcG
MFRHLPQVMAGLGLPLVLAYYAYAWFRIGGAPRRGTVIPLFTPPEGMSAAATRYVRRMEFDGKTFTAALLQLAVNGHLKLVESQKTITIEQQAGGKPVGDAEATAEMRLFHTEPKVPLTRSSALELMSAMNGLKSVFKKHYDNVAFSANTARAVYGLLASFAVMVAVVAANWTQDGDLFSSTLFALLLPVPAMMLGLVLLSGALRSQGMDTVRGLIFGLMFAGGGGYFGLWILFAYRQDWLEVLPTAMAFALAPVAAFAFPLFRMPTKAGRKLIDAIEGFRMYLGVAEEDRLQAFYPPKKTPELFERYLPYAVALDVENAWAKRFEGVLANAETPTESDWYDGDETRRRHPAVLTEFVSKSLSERIASAATAPGTSGSSSGSSHDSRSSGSSGGGSSGGGGGGGGGSGWCGSSSGLPSRDGAIGEHLGRVNCFLFELGSRDRGLDRLDDLPTLERLAQATCRSEVARHLEKIRRRPRALVERIAGDCDNRSLRSALVQNSHGLEAVHSGHEDVDDDGIERIGFDCFHAALTAFGRHDVMTSVL